MMNTTVLESVVLLGLRGVLFFACRKYLLRSLYSDLQALSTPKAALPSPTSASTPNDLPHSILARSVFALSFTESCTMFVLLMTQALDVFASTTRLLHWRISLAILMATILVFAPLCLSLLITGRVFLSIFPVALYLFALSQVPLPAALATTSIAAATLARLIVLGTLILGLLSGFGAVTNAWTFIPRSRSSPTDADVSTADHALQAIRSDLHKRIAEAPHAQDGSWLTRFRGGDSQSQELQGLQVLEHQMSRNLDALRQRRDTTRYAKTFQGRIVNFGGRIFAIYCVVRIFSSIINVLLPVARRSSPAKNYTDLITDLLAHILALVSPVDIKLEAVASFSRQLSLGLVGLIILTNIRLVLRGVTRALRVTSRNRGASVMLLLLAQLMGIYLLTTIVQLRTSFPPPLSSSVSASVTPDAAPPTTPGLDPVRVDDALKRGLDPVALAPDADAPPQPTTADTAPVSTMPNATNLFSTIPEFEVFGSLFDWSFLLAAGGTAFWRWGKERVDGVGDV